MKTNRLSAWALAGVLLVAGGLLAADSRPLNPDPSVPRPNTRTSARIDSNLSAGFNSSGADTAGAAIGTASTVAPTASVPYGHTLLTSGAVSGNQGAVQGQANGCIWQQRPLFQATYVTGSSIAVVRHWVELSTTTIVSMLGVDTPGTSGFSGAGFRFTAGTDTNWQCVTFNGASQTVIDSGVAVAASTAYKFEIYDDGTSTTFRINGNVVGSTTLTRPASTAVVREGAGCQTNEAVAKACGIRTLYLEQD